MNELLSAGFARMFKNRLFWLFVIFMFAFGAGIPTMMYIDYVQHDQYVTGGISRNLGEIFFIYIMVIPFVSAAFVSLFLGTEYSDGTIRNKLIAGRSRSSIYLSNLVLTIAASLIFCLVYIVAECAVGIPMFGKLGIDAGYLVVLLIGNIILICAWSAIFTFVTMISSHKAASAVICLVLSVVLFLAGSFSQAKLQEPEFEEGMTFNTETMQLEYVEGAPNPYYVSGTWRTIYQFVYDFTPDGQGLQYVNAEAEKPGLLMAYSALITAGFTLLGLGLFKRKDIK